MPSSIIVAALSSVLGAVLPGALGSFIAQVAVGVLGSVLPAGGPRKPPRS